MSNKWSVAVTVIVSGRPVAVRAERLRTVRIFINRVIETAEAAPSDYELRDLDGGLIDPGILVKDATAIRTGAMLYLNPRAGVGA